MWGNRTHNYDAAICYNLDYNIADWDRIYEKTAVKLELGLLHTDYDCFFMNGGEHLLFHFFFLVPPTIRWKADGYYALCRKRLLGSRRWRRHQFGCYWQAGPVCLGRKRRPSPPL